MFSAQYIDKSLYYFPWKTKFIEVFCTQYICMINYLKTHKKINGDDFFVVRYLGIYRIMLQILKKKINEGNKQKLKLHSDVIFEAKKRGLIENSEIFYEVLLFLNDYYSNKKSAKDFKTQYISIVKDFHQTFKTLVFQGGTRSESYRIFDNSYCYWGIPKKYLLKLINFFYKYEKIKIVRIFGSRVTDDYREFSDIDLVFEGTYNKEEFKEIGQKLREEEFPYIFDIYDIFWENKPFMYRNIVRSNVLYQRNNYVPDDYISKISQNKNSD